MYSILIGKTNESFKIIDSELPKQIHKMFPKDGKWTHVKIEELITKQKYWCNGEYIVQHSSYDPIGTASRVENKLSNTFDEAPVNTSELKREPRYNEWYMLNTKTGKVAMFHNLAALARGLKIDYPYLYSNICNHVSFKVGKYVFYRHYMPEKDHVLGLLDEILQEHQHERY